MSTESSDEHIHYRVVSVLFSVSCFFDIYFCTSGWAVRVLVLGTRLSGRVGFPDLVINFR